MRVTMKQKPILREHNAYFRIFWQHHSSSTSFKVSLFLSLVLLTKQISRISKKPNRKGNSNCDAKKRKSRPPQLAPRLYVINFNLFDEEKGNTCGTLTAVRTNDEKICVRIISLLLTPPLSTSTFQYVHQKNKLRWRMFVRVGRQKNKDGIHQGTIIKSMSGEEG